MLFLCFLFIFIFFFFFQAEDGIRDLVRSRGLGDVYKRQAPPIDGTEDILPQRKGRKANFRHFVDDHLTQFRICLLYTSDAADERSSVDLGGRRIIKKNKHDELFWRDVSQDKYNEHIVHLW